MCNHQPIYQQANYGIYLRCIFSSQQVFVVVSGLVCLAGFLCAATGAVLIEDLATRSYITRISLLVAAIAISANIMSVSVSRQRIRNARDVVVSDAVRESIEQTRQNTEEIKERLDE